MALVDAAKIEGYLDVDAALAARIVKSVRLAEMYLKGLKGEAWYSAQENEQDQDVPELALYAAEHAESLLAFYYALPHLNVQVDPAGGLLVATWTDDGATKTEKRFASMKSLADLRVALLSQAKLLVEGDVVVEYGEAESTLVSGVLAPVGGGHICVGGIEPGGSYHNGDG